MKSIFLIVDDDEIRHPVYLKALEASVASFDRVAVTSATAAITILSTLNKNICGVVLDGDLGEQSGEDVVKWIVNPDNNCKRLQICISSMNTVKQSRMYMDLKRAGHIVTIIPFSTWLEDSKR